MKIQKSSKSLQGGNSPENWNDYTKINSYSKSVKLNSGQEILLNDLYNPYLTKGISESGKYKVYAEFVSSDWKKVIGLSGEFVAE